MSPDILVILLWIISIAGISGILFCVVLLRSTARDRAAYLQGINDGTNGRRLMVLNTSRRRYSISLLMFIAILIIPLTSVYLEIGIIRSTLNATAFMFVVIAKLVNVALDAKDDKDLFTYGAFLLRRRDDVRDEARDVARDIVRDEHRDIAHDAETEKHT